MNGEEFLNIIRKSKKLKQIPVIVQTRFANAKELQNIQKLRLTDILKKPYNKQTLKDALLKIKS